LSSAMSLSHSTDSERDSCSLSVLVSQDCGAKGLAQPAGMVNPKFPPTREALVIGGLWLLLALVRA
jgi:hypothetical protein